MKSLRHKYSKAAQDKKRSIEIREEFRRLATARYPRNVADINEYISEAEHSDGIEYWVEYGGVDKLVRDFQEYLRIMKETDGNHS